jgi:peroxiredoxin/mono/diheme cytochrome c family protein
MTTRSSALSLAALAFALPLAPALASDEATANLGKKVATFTLTDPRDHRQVSLGDFKDRKAVVVVFVGTECPLSNHYLPRLAELQQEYAPRGVQFLAVNSNTQDTPADMVEHARQHPVACPLLRDEGNRVADDFGARRMTEAFVLDAGGVVRYDGRIDDQYGVGYQRPVPTRRDLAEALDEVLAGKEVARPTAPVAGCRISRARPPRADGEVTYCKQVVRILQKNCQECHRPGQIGPMAFLTYDDARDWAETIREVVQEGRMPPWHADPHYGKFSNDRRLPAEERAELLRWIEEGCPRGDDRDLPAPRDFTLGWRIGRPDLVLSMSQEYLVPAVAPRDGIPYQYFTVDPGFTEDRWVVQAEARAGAAEVVHHVIVFIVPPGQKFDPDRPGNVVLCGSAPGDTALFLPAGTAKRVPAGSKLLFQMHYTPNGKAARDRSSVGLVFAKEPPRWEAKTMPLLNPFFLIPAGADNFKVESRHVFKQDSLILGFMPHMHLRGKDFLYEVIDADGQKETLLSVPHFNFGWQSAYRLAEPRRVARGGTVHCVAHFDNSAGNPNNPDPTADVKWGDQTWEEMMIGWLEYAVERKP